MRPIKDLLILLRKEMPWRIWFGENYGLCGTLVDMERDKIITEEEHKVLKSYLYDHRPAPFGGPLYWFTPCHVWPRYQFLTRLIRGL
jgi:hypothetical protein